MTAAMPSGCRVRRGVAVQKLTGSMGRSTGESTMLQNVPGSLKPGLMAWLGMASGSPATCEPWCCATPLCLIASSDLSCGKGCGPELS
jgi:hypothetical protein